MKKNSLSYLGAILVSVIFVLLASSCSDEETSKAEEVEVEKSLETDLKTQDADLQEGIGIGASKKVEFETNIDESGISPLYVVDGKVVKSINEIDKNTIESMSVLKGESAVEKYGEIAKNGAIEITTKK